MTYLIIGLMVVAALMLIGYFAAAITKNKYIFALFRLLIGLLEVLLVISLVYSFVTGSNFYILIPLILLFGLLIYES